MNALTSVVTVSTDGSCLRNPGGAIGWAWVDHNGKRFDSGGAVSGTNQTSELIAVLEAIKSNPGSHPLLIEADSQYAIRCSSEWLPGWKRKGWRTASGGPVKNLELIQQIDAAITEREGPVRFRWVRGHIGHKFNERADELAGLAAREWAAGRGFTSGALIADDLVRFDDGGPSSRGSRFDDGGQPAHSEQFDGGRQLGNGSQFDDGAAPSSGVIPTDQARASLVSQILAPLAAATNLSPAATAPSEPDPPKRTRRRRPAQSTLF